MGGVFIKALTQPIAHHLYKTPEAVPPTRRCFYNTDMEKHSLAAWGQAYDFVVGYFMELNVSSPVYYSLQHDIISI